MNRPLRADAQRNRDRVLAVAKEAFATEGLAVPIPEIARRAGVGVGTIYRQFPTKEALFEAIVLQSMQAMLERARLLVTADDPGEAFFTFLTDATEKGARDGALKDALAGTGYDIEAATSEAGEELRHIIGGLLERAQQAGAVRPDVTVADVFALVTGVLAATDRHQDKQALRHLLTIVCDGLRMA
jgi:AcrR family transcriptional regulator